MVDVQRPKPIEEVEAEAEGAAHLEAGTAPPPEASEQTEPEPEIQDPTEHYRVKKGINRSK